MFITHERFMDVFCEVLETIETYPNLKLRVRWWNKGQCGAPFSIGIIQNITIENKDLADWRVK